MSAAAVTCRMGWVRAARGAIPRWRKIKTCNRAAIRSRWWFAASARMPPFGDMMNDDQVAAVVNYVRTHFGNNYRDAVTARDVKDARK